MRFNTFAATLLGLSSVTVICALSFPRSPQGDTVPPKLSTRFDTKLADRHTEGLDFAAQGLQKKDDKIKGSKALEEGQVLNTKHSVEVKADKVETSGDDMKIEKDAQVPKLLESFAAKLGIVDGRGVNTMAAIGGFGVLITDAEAWNTILQAMYLRVLDEKKDVEVTFEVDDSYQMHFQMQTKFDENRWL
ncbi:Uu.00g099860.m01.CDS01 [Anthostomella pinea]|uniref:Uu.00g099860.m01.CDS01 n=1 Tax=Anthostomella pinea TaxID=933095 RepID=A0AAI8YFA0_9PEZI|nr:Uu.00g099860.m01.CDS01 [Anthostomella pinea]